MADITPQQLLTKLQEATKSVDGTNFLRTIMLLLERGIECDGSGKAYILGRVGYEYNDEIYYSNESGGSIPESIFLSKRLAEEARDREEMLAFRNTAITQYCYDADDVFCDTDEVLRIWREDVATTKPEWKERDLFKDFDGWQDMPLQPITS